MIKKIEISTILETVTGMHIGGTNEFAAIGAIDSPVVRDSITRKPMIPGSSIKGKIRTLLSRQYSDSFMPVEIKNDPEIVKRLFGSSTDQKFRNSRLQFADSILINEAEIKNNGALRSTEVKFENTIGRLTAVANPRQIERVIPGCKFEIKIIYNIYSPEEIEDDFKAIADGFKLLEYDYLGGNGTRGYGKVKFSNMTVKSAVGDVEDTIINKCNAILRNE